MTPPPKALQSRCTPHAPPAGARTNCAAEPQEEPASKRQKPSESAPRDALAPIGTARLLALREAIRNGTYPTDDQLMGGLERLFEDGPQ